MLGASSPGFEIWIAPNGSPEMIPYAGNPLGQYFDDEALNDVLGRYP